MVSLSPSQHLLSSARQGLAPQPSVSPPEITGGVRVTEVSCPTNDSSWPWSLGPLGHPHSPSLFLLVPGTHSSLALQVRREGRRKCEVPEKWPTGWGSLEDGGPQSPFLHAPQLSLLCLHPLWAQAHRLRGRPREVQTGQRPAQVLRVYPSAQRQQGLDRDCLGVQPLNEGGISALAPARSGPQVGRGVTT